MSGDRANRLVVSFRFFVHRNELHVGAEVDALTAPGLRAALGVLVAEPQDVVVDLAAVTFLDASGLGTIADIAGQLRPSGRVLTVQSAPRRVRWLLELTGLDEVVRFDVAAPAEGLGSEQLHGDGSLGPQRPSVDLVADLVRVGSPPDAARIDAALGRVVVLADATVKGADGVSVTLERDGQLVTAASSNDTVLRMDHHQYRTGQGPCLAAASRGHWFHIESLQHETRWPAFVPHAAADGIASILSSPVMSAERSIGALNIYSNTERTFGPRQQELASLFAAHVSEILADAGASPTNTQMTARITEGLRTRETIARAQGMIMAEQGVTANIAATRLHQAARTARCTVLTHATTLTSAADATGNSA